MNSSADGHRYRRSYTFRIVRSAALPAVPERIENIVRFVDHRPKLIGTRNKRQPFGISDPAGENSAVLVNRTANRVAHRVYRICIRRGGNINIEFVIWIDNEILQLVTVESVQLGAAAVR